MARVLLLAGTDTLAGTLNKTRYTIYVDASQSLNIYLKPSSASLANNPTVILPWVLNMFQAIIVLVFAFSIPIAHYILSGDSSSGKTQRSKVDGGREEMVKKKKIKSLKILPIVLPIVIILLFSVSTPGRKTGGRYE